VDIDGQEMPYLLATSVHTGLFNLTGSPAIVLPFAHSKEGLPIGVQLVGKRWDDMALLSVAQTLTYVTGPFRHPPGM
jgi:amidase